MPSSYANGPTPSANPFKNNGWGQRFFINPQKQGQGLGSQALRKFVSLAFENEDIDTISLNVFEANQTAKHLYQKEGFEIVQMVEVPIRKYIMKKGR